MTTQLKRVVILGPESTGKTTLTKKLAQHFHTSWVPEYARDFLEQHGTSYTYDDLLTISKGQVAAEDQVAHEMFSGQGNQILFLDTDLQVMKVWCEFVFNMCHQWIINQISIRNYDLYLLCNIDLPWVKDELREYPDLGTRQKLYFYYKDILVNQDVEWVDISGNNSERTQKAILAIQNKFKIKL